MNFIEVIGFIRTQFALSAISDKVLRLPPFLMLGEPGVGKTEFMLTLENYLNSTLEVIDISTSQLGAALSGSDHFWGNTKTGMLFNTLMYGDLANPIILLDEIDKARSGDDHDPLAALHQLLEQRQAKKFYDLSVPEIKIDASHVLWIATANNVELIEGQIVDRFTTFNISTPTQSQMKVIVNNLPD